MAVLERTYRLVDYSFRVVATDARLDTQLTHLLGRFTVGGSVAGAVDGGTTGAGQGLPLYRLSEEGGRYTASLDGVTLNAHEHLGLPMMNLVWRVSFEAIPLIRRDLAFHAGVVALDGAGVVLPAASGSGKSTLVAGLVHSGADYLSDEIALLDGLMLRPVPRPLGLSVASIELIDGLAERLPPELEDPHLDQCVVAPDDLRPDCVGSSCPLRLVVFPTYQAGATTTLEPVRRSLGVLELIDDCFNFEHFGAAGLHALAEATSRVAFYRLRSGSLVESVEAVRSLAGDVGAFDGR